MRIFLIATCLLTFLVSSASAEQNVNLYKDYYYGMPIDDVIRISGASPCEDEEFEGDLCIESVNFSGEEWAQVLQIDNNKLVSLILMKEDENRTSFNVLVNMMEKNGYGLLFAQNGKTQIDAMALYTQGSDVLKNKLSDFLIQESIQESEFSQYTFFNKKNIREVKKNNDVTDIVSFIQNAPIDTKEIDINRIDSITMVKFSAPIAFNRDQRNEVNSINESF